MPFFKAVSPRRWFGIFWRFLDATRRSVLNLLFLGLIIFIISSMSSGGKKLEDKTALLLDFKGALVEQHAGSVRDTLVSEVQGDEKDSVQLRDILEVLDSAAKDPKIGSAVLLMDDFEGAGMPMLREVGAAIDRFRASGKKVIAWGSSYNQRQYFVAVHADQILLHPMGTVELEGFGGYRNYYRDALDKLGITVNLMRVGTYKSFAEPYIANAPSPAALEAESFLYNGMWKNYTDTVEKTRKLPAGSIMAGINDLPQRLQDAGGDMAKLALSSKLVDGLKTRDELRQLMLTEGARDDKIHSFRQVTFEDYLSMQKPEILGDAVAVVVASGKIGDGTAPPGAIGGLSTANMIRSAREDDQVKAIVLRVDSPGGSAFGAELIRRELEITRKAGKPVIISMGDVAASGGYWISMAADEVIADPATITGSIGVFAILPTADKALNKLGVHSGGVTTTWLRDGYDPTRPMDPKFSNLIQLSVNHIYADFTAKAAAARNTTAAKIDAVAQGRVWTGDQAKERGLIDALGSYNDALDAAAKRAKLGNHYRVTYIEREPSGVDRLIRLFDTRVAQIMNNQFDRKLTQSGIPATEAHKLANDFGWLANIAENHKPFTAVTHCFCQQP